MGIPPSPPRATITLGLGLIEAHSPVSALLCVYPPNRPTSSESHIVAADILQCPGHYKNPPYLLLDPLQQHHRVSPSERLISERLAFDTLSISLTVDEESARLSNYAQDIVNYTQNAADASMLANVNLPTLNSTLHV